MANRKLWARYTMQQKSKLQFDNCKNLSKLKSIKETTKSGNNYDTSRQNTVSAVAEGREEADRR
jgi:hypothetical protein